MHASREIRGIICYSCMFFSITRGLSPHLLAIARQPPGTAYVVPIRITLRSVLTSLAHHAMVAELRLPIKLNLVFP